MSEFELKSQPKWKRGDTVVLNSSPYFPITVRSVQPVALCDASGANQEHDGWEYSCCWIGAGGTSCYNDFHEDMLKDYTPPPQPT